MLAENFPKTSRLVEGIKPDTWNGLREALREKPLNQPGYSFTNRQVVTKNLKPDRSYFYFIGEEALTERCIFGITDLLDSDESDFNDPAQVIHIAQINSLSPASQFGLFTNLDAYNPEDVYGICKAIDFYEPTLLFVSDIDFFPTIGMPCGPDENVTNWGISANSKYGLICISGPDDNNNVWCIRTPDPISVIGNIVDETIPAYNTSTDELGAGFIEVLYRDIDNQLVAATGPDGEPLQLPVFNTSGNSYQVGQFVKCICVSGVGLVILDSQSIIWGLAKQNIPHFTSGLVNIYTGTPGDENWDDVTSVLAFNYLSEVVKDEWCFLVPSGNTAIPYYIINNEYQGKVLGKTKQNVIGVESDEPGNAVNVEVFGGIPGKPETFTATIVAYVNSFWGAIPAGTFVQCEFLGSDNVASEGGWFVTATQRGNTFAARVNPGSANPSTGYAPVDEFIQVTLYDHDICDNDTGISVPAAVIYAPVLDNERVHVEWNGDIFVVTKGELDGGFWAYVAGGDIQKGSTGQVTVKQMTNSPEIQPSYLEVTSLLGTIPLGKLCWVSRNRDGFMAVSAEC